MEVRCFGEHRSQIIRMLCRTLEKIVAEEAFADSRLMVEVQDLIYMCILERMFRQTRKAAQYLVPNRSFEDLEAVKAAWHIFFYYRANSFFQCLTSVIARYRIAILRPKGLRKGLGRTP
jgi:hypothetical protein